MDIDMDIKIDLDMESEISKIISNIKHKEVRSLAEIRKTNMQAVEEAYAEFMEFEQNHYNKEEVKTKLAMYEFVPYEHLTGGDYVRYIDKKFFFNMKLDNGGKILSIRKDKMLLWSIKKKRVWIGLDNYIFRRLTEEDFAKIKLVELIGRNM
jgi:hypothetical protein